MKYVYLILISTCLVWNTQAQSSKKKSKNKKSEETNTEKESSSKPEPTSNEKPVMKVQLGYTGYVQDYALSNSGKFMVMATSDYTAKIWEISTARELLTLERDTLECANIRYSMNDEFILATYGRDDLHINILNASSGKIIASRNVNTKNYYMTQVLPNNTELLYIERNSGIGNRIYLDNIKTNKTIRTFLTEGTVNRFKLSADGKFVCAQTDNNLYLWETSTGKLSQNIAFKTAETVEINNKFFDQSVPFFTPDNQFVYYHDDNKIKRLNLQTLASEATSIQADGNYVASFSADGKSVLVTSGNETNLRYYQLSPVVKLVSSPFKHPSYQGSLISSDGSVLVQNSGYYSTMIGGTKSANDTIQTDYYEMKIANESNLIVARGSGQVLVLEGHSGQVLKEFKGVALGLNFARFSPDGKSAIWIQDSTKVVCWNMASGNLIREFDAHVDDITKIAFSNDGKYMATAGMDKCIKLWDYETGKLIRSHSVYTKWISALEFSNDNFYLAAQAEELTFKVWEVKSGKELKKFKGHTERVTCLKFSSDGKQIISGAWDQTIRIWNIATSTQVKLITGFEHPIVALELSTDGKTLAVGGGEKRFGTLSYDGENKIALYDLSTYQLKKKLSETPSGNIIQFAFSPDGKFLISRTDVNDRIPGWEIIDLSSHYTQDFNLYNLETGTLVKNFSGNHQDMKSLFALPGKLIYPGEDYTLRIWNLTSMANEKSLEGHRNPISNIACSKDGKQLISRSTEEGIIKLWELESGKNTLNFIALGGRHNDYLIASPENYYMCSKGGAAAVHFVLNKHAYEFAQFDLQYNRPDKVLAYIKGTDPELINSFQKAYQKRLKKQDFTEDMFSSDLHLPIIKINTTKAGAISKTRDYVLQISASDSKFTLDRILVSVNEVPVNGSKGIDLKTLKTKSHERTISIKLSSGENHIKVSCINAKGVESLSSTIDVVCAIPEYKPTLYLITVGVSKFKDAKMNLQYAAKDASDIQLLLGKSSNAYANIKSFSFLDEKATKENILGVKSQLMGANPDDVVLFMVSSHGILNEELDYFIATHDMDFTNPSARGLSYEALESILDGIPQRKKLLFMDACHSGEVDKDEMQLVKNDAPTEDGKDLTFRALPGTGVKKIGTENTFEMMKELFSDLRKGSGATVISSAGGGEYAIEGDQWSNGVFTFCLINALRDKQADFNKDSQITLTELQDYLFQKVPKLTNNKQKPTSRAENIRFDFAIWK